MSPKHKLPHVGMRIIKTAVAVMICLILNYLFGANVGAISAWAALICVQSSLESSLKTGLSRFIGTALGGVVAIIVLPIAHLIELEWFHIILIPAGIILVIYLCVLIKMPGAASMGAFVYIAILILPFDPNSKANPYTVALYRIADTLVGVLIGLLVNRYIAPPKLMPKTSVHIVANTYKNIYGRVKNDIANNIELILFDTAIADPSAPKHLSTVFDGEFNIENNQYDLRIPVPTEFQTGSELKCVYIDENYNVENFNLKQSQGYVLIPAKYYPATVVWHTEQSKKALNTYGIIHKKTSSEHHLKKGSLIKNLTLHRESKDTTK